MPPKKITPKNDKNEKKEPQFVKDENKLYEVDKEFFEIQYEAKEKIIARLQEIKFDLEKNIEKLKKKTDNVSSKFRDDYEDLTKMFEEKKQLHKKLKAEIADLQNELDSMSQKEINILKKKDDEFIRKAGIIKSITAVHVGRFNKLEEFSKQQEMLEQKYEHMSEQIRKMNEAYELTLKNTEEKYVQTKKVVKREMLRRCNDLVIHLHKGQFLNTDFIPGTSNQEINELKDMLNATEEQKEISEKKLLDIKTSYRMYTSFINSNQTNLDEIYSEKKTKFIGLKKELNKLDMDINGIRKQVEENKDRTSSDLSNVITDDTSHKSLVMDNEMQAARKKLNDIQTANFSLDEQIFKMEMFLLKVYEEAFDHVEEIKYDENNYKKKSMELIKRLYEKLEPYLISEDVETYNSSNSNLSLEHSCTDV